MNPQYVYSSSDTVWSEEAERRVADLATFADGFIHDLRNPLNVIRTSLYLLRQKLPSDDPSIARVVNRIEDQVTAEERLLEAAQAFYKSGRPAFQRIDLNDLVRRAAES